MDIEEIIKSLISSVKAGNITDHVKENDFESWSINDYVIEVSQRVNISGKQFQNVLLKQNNKVINLGKWKKKLFYTLVYNLQNNKIFNKIQKDPTFIKEIMTDIKNNPANWTVTDCVITGQYNNDNYEIRKERIEYESGKKIWRNVMKKNNTVILKGSQLLKIFKNKL